MTKKQFMLKMSKYKIKIEVLEILAGNRCLGNPCRPRLYFGWKAWCTYKSDRKLLGNFFESPKIYTGKVLISKALSKAIVEIPYFFGIGYNSF